MARQARQIADEARLALDAETRALRAATRTADEVAVFGSAVYALGNALLGLCPWCKKGLAGLRRMIHRPFCPHCHRDVREWSEEQQEEWELHWKSIRAEYKIEKKVKEIQVLHKTKEDGVVNKARTRKATNRE